MGEGTWLKGNISWVQRNLSHAFNASRNTLITMGWRGISGHHIWWIVNVTFVIYQSYMRCTYNSMLRMSITLKPETCIPPFQDWGFASIWVKLFLYRLTCNWRIFLLVCNHLESWQVLFFLIIQQDDPFMKGVLKVVWQTKDKHGLRLAGANIWSVWDLLGLRFPVHRTGTSR